MGQVAFSFVFQTQHYQHFCKRLQCPGVY